MRAKRGFTLIELIIIILIVGILAALAIPKYGNIVTYAKVAQLRAKLAVLRSGLRMYYVDSLKDGGQGGYPVDLKEVMPEGAGVPVNPRVEPNSAVVVPVTGNPGQPSIWPLDGSAGWYYNSATGKVWACNNTDL